MKKKFLTIPRIISIMLIALAIWAFRHNQVTQAIILLIAGLILLLTKNKEAKKQWKEFLQSLRPGKKWVIIVLIDAVFYGIFTGLSLVLIQFMQKQISVLSAMDLASPQLLQSEIADASIAAIQGVLANLLAGLAIFYLLTMLAYTICRGFIWLKITGKKANFRFFAKFFLLNLLWITIIIIILLLLATSMLPQIAGSIILAVVLLSVHLTSVMHYSFAKTSLLWNSVKQAFAKGLGKIRKFIHLYCYAFIILIIIQQVMRLPIADKLLLAISLLLMLMYAGWYRLYISQTLKKAL